MRRIEFPRLHELRDTLPTPLPPDAYFHDCDSTLAESPQKRRQFRDIESDVQSLDPEAWAFLKAELTPLLTAKHPKRGWQQLFDKLNQAKGYRYLVACGCTNVRFIPESKMNGQRSPDLQGNLEGILTLCEVKTINVSDEEADRLHGHRAFEVTDQLSEGFFTKLASTLRDAEAQMNAFSQAAGVRKIAYVIVNFDDRLGEYADRYRAQIDERHSKITPPDIEVELDIKPAFYTAMS